MYNKYIINRLLLWDSEEPACVGGCFFFVCLVFFFCLLFLVWPYGGGWTWTSLLRRVLVLLCAPAAEVHPPQVVPVCYPVVGTQSAASAVRRGVPAHRTWEGTEGWRWWKKVGGGKTEREGNEFDSEHWERESGWRLQRPAVPLSVCFSHGKLWLCEDAPFNQICFNNSAIFFCYQLAHRGSIGNVMVKCGCIGVRLDTKMLS